MGQETYHVSLKNVFGQNRRKLCKALQQKPVSEGNLVVYLHGGPSETRFDSDHEPLFRQESYFWYLTGVKEPDCAIAIDVATQHATLFIPNLPASYATIMGRIKTREEWKEHYQVGEVLFTDDVEDTLAGMLEKRSNGTKSKLLLMKGLNSDSGKVYEPPVTIVNHEKLSSHVDVELLFPILAECRVFKTTAEQGVLQFVTEVTSFAHAYVMRNMKPGMMEYQGESLFRHYCYYNYGCRLVGYTPICGCGPDAAVLHYGHAGEPNARQSNVGDNCLFDMGAEYFGYGSDVTCSFPIDGVFNDRQRPIYQAVLNAQIAVYRMIKPGVSYVACHKAAEAAILKVLVEVGIVNLAGKTIDDLVEMRLGAVFMPHGLGHFIGIDTHDVGGYLAGHPERSELPGLKSLRTARILLENMTLTVEPGCYFIDHLLNEALAEGSFLKVHMNEAKVNHYRGFGGVRLEDVIVVTADGIINYTLCPRTIEEVESVMAGGKWPPTKDIAPELFRARLTEPNPLPSPPSL
jgi:Xaa-Pro dipeptidase